MTHFLATHTKEKAKRQLIEELGRLRREMAELKDKNLTIKQVLHQNAETATLENSRLDQIHQQLADRLEIETELRQIAARNQAMLHAIPDSLLYFNREGQLLDYKVANPSNLEPGIQGKIVVNGAPNWKPDVPADLVGLIRTHIGQTLASGTMEFFEYDLSLPQGERTFEVRLIPSGPNEVLAMVRNITRRRQMQAALKNSEANLRAILDNSLLPFILLDKVGKVQAFNKPAYKRVKASFGKELEQGSFIYDFVPEADLEEFERCFEQAIQGNPISVERSIHIGDGDRWFEFRFNPVFADDGQVLGVCFGSLDIDQQKQMINALATHEARLLEEMESVLVISRALVSELNLDTLLEFIMTQAEHLIQADGALVLLLTEDSQHLEVAPPGEAWLPVKPGTQFPLHGSIAELAIASQKVQMNNQVQLNDRFAFLSTILPPVEVGSLLCASLKSRQKKMGVLLVWSRNEHAFTEEDGRLIGLFADQAALALQNAHLHAENRKMAIEQERHRLARGLHDSTKQSLHSIGLVAEAALRSCGPETNGKVRDGIEFIQMLANGALIEMREQLYDLLPSNLMDKGLVAALSGYIDTLGRQYQLAIEFRPDEDLPLSMYQQASLYFIAREALWNVVKHAQATKVEISLSQDDDQIILSLVDNGLGFDPVSQETVETLGIRNMEERAILLGGKIELRSQPGNGTQLTVYVPQNPP